MLPCSLKLETISLKLNAHCGTRYITSGNIDDGEEEQKKTNETRGERK